eukprot:1366130-Rhodomonas_salina.3
MALPDFRAGESTRTVLIVHTSRSVCAHASVHTAACMCTRVGPCARTAVQQWIRACTPEAFHMHTHSIIR